MSTAVLPPIAASTWPTSVVGTATHGTPRRYVAAAKPAVSVSAPPPSATTVPPRSSVSSDHSRSTTPSLLRLLARRQLVRRDEPVAERLLRARPVDAHHRRVGDERDRAVAGHELAEQLERTELVVDARGGEHRAVDVVSTTASATSR